MSLPLATRSSDIVGDACAEVHAVGLDPPQPSVARCWELLDEEERGRARRFRFDRHRRRFVVCRAAVREILGALLAVPAGEVTFVTGQYGKPRLHPRHASDWRFNVSHSSELALCAVSRGKEAGVDIERIRGIPELDDLAVRCLSPTERRSVLLATTPEARTERFFRSWTLKEAWLKGTGSGLTESLAAFEVVPDGAGTFRVRHSESGAAEPWVLSQWEPAPGYVAALAVERETRTEEGRNR